MTREDWLDFFETINGRSATEEEIAAALSAGEFQDTAAPDFQGTDSAAGAAQPQAAFQQSAASSQPVQSQSAAQQPSNEYAAFNQAPNQAAQSQQFQQGPAAFQQQQQQGMPNNQQQFQQTQGFQQQPPFNGPAAPKQPSAFTSLIKDFWDWLFNAWKKPATVFSNRAANGFISFGLHVVLFTIFLFTLIYKTVTGFIGGYTGEYGLSVSGYDTSGIGFSAFFFILLSAIILIFAYTLAGFAARKAIHRDAATTFVNSFEKFGRLTALNLPIMLLGFLVSLIGLTGFGNFLFFIAILVYSLANVFITFPLDSNATWDKFYQYIVSFLINTVIVGIAFYLILTILGNYIQSVFPF